ncbi:MAG TPA: TylF/MycF/NovP-related O-methyltransferase [Stellaceae bacterium]|nr:TylF/MycF/NovP-related O-methyltransferase [Stellaceae bacterium]
METVAKASGTSVDQGDRQRHRDGRLRGLPLAATLLRHRAIYRRFRHFTMIPRQAYLANLYLAARCLAAPAMAGGCIIECGTWRGGMAAGLATIGGAARDYHFFDSFAGLPPASAEDGDYARDAQARRDGRLYFDNNTAALEDLMAAFARVALPPERLHVHKGFFADTFPGVSVPPIAVLRLDADWYGSTLLCLEKFWGRLMPGALMLIDDYYDWEGCTKAVHEFLARRGAVEPIRQSRFGKVAYLLKR